RLSSKSTTLTRSPPPDTPPDARTGPPRDPPMKFKRLIVQAGKQFLQDNAMAHAAAVAFYTALSFAPLVLLIMTFGGLLGNGARYELVDFFEEQAGPGAADVAEGVIESSQEDRQRGSIWQWLLSTGMLLFTASAV